MYLMTNSEPVRNVLREFIVFLQHCDPVPLAETPDLRVETNFHDLIPLKYDTKWHPSY
jgi:hypothetical protein